MKTVFVVNTTKEMTDQHAESIITLFHNFNNAVAKFGQEVAAARVFMGYVYNTSKSTEMRK